MYRALIVGLFLLFATAGAAMAQSALQWADDFPLTNFAERSIDLGEVVGGVDRPFHRRPICEVQWVRLAEVRLRDKLVHNVLRAGMDLGGRDDVVRVGGGWVIIHGRNEETNKWIVAQPDVMVASDGVPFVGDFSHPRSAGTFARILGYYVRDEQALSMMVALRKMTLDPAKRLEAFAPAMRLKGRVQEGMDADLTIFDPKTILDQATYSVPARTSAGIVHVLVKGIAVVRDGVLVDGVYPGEAIRSEWNSTEPVQ